MITFVYVYVTGRPYGKPGDLKTILYVLASALPVSLIIFDRSQKQIFTYISVVLNYLLEIKNEKVAVLEMRTIAANYIKGMEGSTKIKQSIFTCKTKEELIKILEEYRKTL